MVNDGVVATSVALEKTIIKLTEQMTSEDLSQDASDKRQYARAILDVTKALSLVEEVYATYGSCNTVQKADD